MTSTRITEDRIDHAIAEMHETGKDSISISDTNCGLHITATKTTLVARYVYEDEAVKEWRSITLLGEKALSLAEIYELVGVLNEMRKNGSDPHTEAHGLFVKHLQEG